MVLSNVQQFLAHGTIFFGRAQVLDFVGILGRLKGGIVNDLARSIVWHGGQGRGQSQKGLQISLKLLPSRGIFIRQLGHIKQKDVIGNGLNRTDVEKDAAAFFSAQ